MLDVGCWMFDLRFYMAIGIEIRR